jgi:cytochrome c oxidase subunit IV
MSARIISPTTYLLVLVALIVLTCLTVGLSFLTLEPRWHFTLGMVIAVCKASLVALFFMHLIHGRPSIWSVVCVSVFWAVIVLGGLTFSDYLTRAWIPFVPGH